MPTPSELSYLFLQQQKYQAWLLPAANGVIQIAQRLSDAVNRTGGNDFDLVRLLFDEELIDRVATAIAKRDDEEVFTITIDPSINIADDPDVWASLVTAGDYDHVDPDITKAHFPPWEWRMGSKAQTEVILVNLEGAEFGEEAIRHLDCRGLRPATMVELLAFGAQHPSQRQCFIMALGQSWKEPSGNIVFGCISEHAKRSLDLYDDVDFTGDTRYLAVLKKKFIEPKS